MRHLETRADESERWRREWHIRTAIAAPSAAAATSLFLPWFIGGPVPKVMSLYAGLGIVLAALAAGAGIAAAGDLGDRLLGYVAVAAALLAFGAFAVVALTRNSDFDARLGGGWLLALVSALLLACSSSALVVQRRRTAQPPSANSRERFDEG